jgi:hypothetical protein
MYTAKEVSELPIDMILQHVWPENVPLMRDSGLWACWPDDDPLSDTLYDQGENESFADFVYRAVADMLNKEHDAGNGWGITVDYAVAFSKTI